LPCPRSEAALRELPDDRYLSALARSVFRSGFVWKIVDYKWPAFEEIFSAFDPVACAYLPGETIEALLGDTRVIRHYRKLLTIPGNASFVLGIAGEYGSFGTFIADWPPEDIGGLHEVLRRRGHRLGGRTGQFFLRYVGKDTYVLSRDVIAALVNQGVVDRRPTSKRDLGAVQEAFNAWREESGRPLCQVSRILSCSVDG